MAWIYLGLAALFEVLFAVSMKQSHGLTRLWPSILTIVGAVGGLGLLALALRTIPLSVGYPVWVGLGTLGTVLIGVLAFHESLSTLKLVSVTLILVGVVGLKLSATDEVHTGAGVESTGPATSPSTEG